MGVAAHVWEKGNNAYRLVSTYLHERGDILRLLKGGPVHALQVGALAGAEDVGADGGPEADVNGVEHRDAVVGGQQQRRLHVHDLVGGEGRGEGDPHLLAGGHGDLGPGWTRRGPG